jgi:mRNA-degrading endonuclease toxin of MazEF toxin-antitoxin module
MITNQDMEKGKLVKVSNAKVDKISSINQNLVIFRIGRVTKGTLEKLKDMLLDVVN